MSKKPTSGIIALQDTREQDPLDLEKYGLTVEVATLPYGDYTLKYPDLQREVIIERKSLPDFVACCGRERERFDRELVALRGYRLAYVVGEFGLRDILGHEYRSQISPNAVLSSIAKWETWGIRFVFCDTHEGASYIVAKMLYFIGARVIELASSQLVGTSTVTE